MDDGGGQVGLVAGSNTAIWVKPTIANQTGGPGGKPIPVDIEFTIASSPTSPDNFSLVPTGIKFMQTRGNGDPSGNANFSSSTPVGTAITVSDKWLARGKPSQSNAPKWEYYIAVTDSTSGTSGWIDPGIENAED